MINIFSFSLYIPLFNEEEGIEHLFNNINDGLDETIKWYKKNKHFFKDNIYNI